jgi:hypothetical protein
MTENHLSLADRNSPRLRGWRPGAGKESKNPEGSGGNYESGQVTVTNLQALADKRLTQAQALKLEARLEDLQV